MKQFKTILMTIAAASLTFVGVAFAEDTKAPAATENHEQHHTESQAKEKPKDAGMMGSMKMDDMTGMMHDCTSGGKDGRMCDHETMQKCQEKMGKGDCLKMMKQAKAKSKPNLKK